LYYILLFLAVFLVLTLFGLIRIWGTTFDPQSVPPAYLVSASFIISGRNVLSAAVLLSIVLLLFRLVGLGGNRILSLFLIGASAFAVYIGGLFLANRLAESLRPDARTAAYALPERQFLSFPTADIYVGSASHLELSPVVVYQPDGSPGFSRYASAVRDPSANELLVPEAGEAFSISEARQAYVSLFDPPPFLKSLFGDVSTLTERLTAQWADRSALFYLTPLSLVMLAVASWCFVRLTRWPLFNGILVLLFIRGVVHLYALFAGEFFRELMAAVVEPEILAYFAPGFFILVAMVLYAIALLMPPFEQWKREISDE
jgi:hypothetical protein